SLAPARGNEQTGTPEGTAFVPRTMNDLKPVSLIAEPIQVQFDQPPALIKRPGCPNRFIWHERTFEVAEKLSEWHDYRRRGRMAHNMRPDHAAAAARRGSWGVGRDYFRVCTRSGRIFDLYYDRAPKHAADREGAWFLYRELSYGDAARSDT
ncbi:MAG: hypothetical protein KAS81_05315, partial [Anaerolineales bacterium]|nr:hypothetical protein [Anaerolineales bacterium]